MDKPQVAGDRPLPVELEPGKRYAWCSCGLSQSQPMCDGSHRGTDFKPVLLEVEQPETVYFCTCKQTCNQPRCDGAHKSLGSSDSGPDSP